LDAASIVSISGPGSESGQGEGGDHYELRVGGKKGRAWWGGEAGACCNRAKGEKRGRIKKENLS